MPYFPSLGPKSGVPDAMALNPQAARSLMDYHVAVLRGPSPLTAAERELIAAFVSGLNACTYCHGVHTATAEAFGVDAGLLEALVSDESCAVAEERLRPLLVLARRLTLTPARMVEADIRVALDAGWSERAVHDAINVIALFNFMNRVVNGHGLSLDPAGLAERGVMLMGGGYPTADPL